MFENASEGRDEVEDRLLRRIVRVGHRWEKVEGGGSEEGDDGVQSVDFYEV
jgi:hypothetical protein